MSDDTSDEIEQLEQLTSKLFYLQYFKIRLNSFLPSLQKWKDMEKTIYDLKQEIINLKKKVQNNTNADAALDRRITILENRYPGGGGGIN